MTSSTASWLPTVIFVPLIGFGLYRRFKRTFGPQPLRARHMVPRMVLLTIISILFLAWIPNKTGIAAASAGAIVGGILAAFGLAHTTYEVTDAGTRYTPNKWIGLLVTTLFLGRLVARMFTIYQMGAHAEPGASPFSGVQRSPFTLGIFFLMATYYIVYYAGVLKKGKTLTTRTS